MRGKVAKALRKMSKGLACIQGLPENAWDVIQHPNRTIKVPKLRTMPDGGTEQGYEHIQIEVFQIVLAASARRIYQTMKKRYKGRL